MAAPIGVQPNIVINNYNAGILDGIFSNAARKLQPCPLAARISILAFSALFGIAIAASIVIYHTAIPVVAAILIGTGSFAACFHFMADWAKAIILLARNE